MERLSGQSGENGRSDQPQTVKRPEPTIEAPVVDEVDIPSEAPVVDKVETLSEAQIADHIELTSDPQIDIAEGLPSQPPEDQDVEEKDMEIALTPENAFQSGMLQKHLDTQPKEKNADVEPETEEVLEEAQSASDSDDALETLQEILDGEILADGTEDQLVVEEDFFENLEKELSFGEGDEALGLSGPPSEEPVSSPPPERSKIRNGTWPPRRPSEMDDFDKYK